MKTKSFLQSIFLLAASLTVLVSCDEIDAPYVIEKAPVDTTACPVPDFPVLTTHIQRALVEDYTGHNCPNCPSAGLVTEEMKEHYGDDLVVMAVHAGWFANVSATDTLWMYDFRTEAGTAWDDFFKVGAISNPNGMVNRIGYPDNQQVLSPSAWNNTVATVVAQTPLLDLQIINDYDADEDKLCIHCKTTFLQTISGRSLNLEVVLTEDSIIEPQKNSNPQVGETPQILDYVHMHVLRGAVNGTWGTPILLKENSSGEPVINTYKTHFTNFNVNTMVPANCHVIAFVYDVDTKEILQVAESKVVL